MSQPGPRRRGTVTPAPLRWVPWVAVFIGLLQREGGVKTKPPRVGAIGRFDLTRGFPFRLGGQRTHLARNDILGQGAIAPR